MDVSLDDIKQAFDAIQKKVKTREEVADWAVQMMKAEDSRELNYIPLSQEGRIWDAIIWLIGIDLRDESGAYFHSEASIDEYRKRSSI